MGCLLSRCILLAALQEEPQTQPGVTLVSDFSYLLERVYGVCVVCGWCVLCVGCHTFGNIFFNARSATEQAFKSSAHFFLKISSSLRFFSENN